MKPMIKINLVNQKGDDLTNFILEYILISDAVVMKPITNISPDITKLPNAMQ
jgi:hypothetical protein